ncbi:MAG: pro-sigmaK processing inhibitor BofA family protein [Lachnospiraceae bacterium]|nr:pro-sigmaK processing inhibitor BofA family protein [Lachnospiraceae bacterium]
MLEAMDGAWIILGVTGIILLIICIKKIGWILRMIARGCAGAALIYTINTGLAFAEMPYGVGINQYTIGFVSFLGLPGIGVLYILAFFL